MKFLLRYEIVHLVVKSMMEKTRSNLTSPVELEQVYLEAYRRDTNKKMSIQI